MWNFNCRSARLKQLTTDSKNSIKLSTKDNYYKNLFYSLFYELMKSNLENTNKTS